MSGEPKVEAFWLSDLRFANFKSGKKSDIHETEKVPHYNPPSTTWHGSPIHPGEHYPYAKGNAYDRLAADKPGEELTPEATIWKLYVAEAKEFDEEMVQGEHRNIDVMLVFAALFSAILTTFLQNSTSLMQANPEDTNTMLLTRIAQRLENPNAPFYPVEIPTFTPSASARWINGLWFISLGLSLAAALLAMLAKEWLNTYVTSRPRPPHDYAIERQARLDALSSWGALQIIDHLSLFLHVALLLFSLGLVIYIYSAVDLRIAMIITVITGATALFYIITTALGALYEVCPFGTQLSHYTRRVLRFLAHHWKFRESLKQLFKIRMPQPSDHTTEGDLHALRWLAHNARDPRIGDSAYQALAGLRLTPYSDPATPPPGAPSAKREPGSDTQSAEQAKTLDVPSADQGNGSGKSCTKERGILAKSAPADKILANMFTDICHRIHDARSVNPHELAVSFGTTVARYSSTLPQLVHYFHLHEDKSRLAKLVADRVEKIGAKFQKAHDKFDAPKRAIVMLDCILRDDCPPFTADAYAWITAAEFRLSTTISAVIEDHSKTEDLSVISPEKESRSDVVLDTRSLPTEINPFDLRARYSRSLARASILIQLHVNGKATMSTFTLIHLLDSMQNAAECTALNPSTSISTHHPQDPGHPDVLPNFYAHLPGTGLTCALPYGAIGEPRGVLGGILSVFGASGARYSVGVERAAGYALNSMAPLLIRQCLKLEFPPKTKLQKLNRNSQSVASHEPQPSRSSSTIQPVPPFLDLWPSGEQPLEADRVTEWVLQQLLHLAAIAKFYHNTPGIGQLLLLSLQAFNNRSKDCSPQSMPFTVAERNMPIVKYLVETVDPDVHTAHEKHSIDEHLLRLLAFKDEDKTVFARSKTDLSHLFRLVQGTPSSTSSTTTVETLLADISEYGYHHDRPHFSNSGNGFLQLVKIAERVDYAPAVAHCVFDLVSKLPAGQSVGRRDMILLVTEDVKCFLKAVAIALERPPSQGYNGSDLLVFLQNTFSILQSLGGNGNGRRIITEHLPRVKLEEIMQANLGSDDLKKSISDGLRQFEPIGGAATTGLGLTTKEHGGISA